MEQVLAELATRVATFLHERHWRLVTVESCTGGWTAKILTDIPGSSAWFDRGYVVYNGKAKHDMLGVSLNTIQQNGEVSEAVVRELVQGALDRADADIALAISGIAGPGGATQEKPVGMVCFAWGGAGQEIASETQYFSGDREAVRRQAVVHSLHYILNHY